MRSVRSTLIVLAIVASGSIAMIRGGFGGWFLFGALFLSTVIHLVFLIGCGRFSVTRSAPRQVAAGEAFEVEVVVERRGRFPVPWVTVSDEWHVRSTSLWNRRRWRYTYTVPGLSRGVYAFGHVRIQCEDTFGWFARVQMVKSEAICWVIPREQRWPQFLRMAQMPAEDEWRVRPYVVGDAVRSVHWKLSARLGKWVVKERGRTAPDHWLIVLEDNSNLLRDAAFERLLEYARGFLRTLPRDSTCDLLCTTGEGWLVRARWPHGGQSLLAALAAAGTDAAPKLLGRGVHEAVSHQVTEKTTIYQASVQRQRSWASLSRALANVPQQAPVVYLSVHPDPRCLAYMTRLAKRGRTVFAACMADQAWPDRLQLLSLTERDGLRQLTAAGGQVVVLDA